MGMQSSALFQKKLGDLITAKRKADGNDADDATKPAKKVKKKAQPKESFSRMVVLRSQRFSIYL